MIFLTSVLLLLPATIRIVRGRPSSETLQNRSNHDLSAGTLVATGVASLAQGKILDLGKRGSLVPPF